MPNGKAWLTKVKNELEFSFLVKLNAFVALAPYQKRAMVAWLALLTACQLPAVKVIPPKRVRPQETEDCWLLSITHAKTLSYLLFLFLE